MRINVVICLLLLILSVSTLYCQETIEGPNFPEYPENRRRELKGGVTLPLIVDNSKQEWFPPVVNQYGWSCNQVNSIGYLLTYELNRQRNLPGDSIQNQYPPLYAWNFLNSNSSTGGVSYFDSWEIIKANGCPNYIDFPYTSNNTVWMSGYDKYYRSMKNKVLNNYSINVADVDGLLDLKTYLYNHHDNYKFGGVANIQIASGGMQLNQLPKDSYNAGQTIITRFGKSVGHAMTIVGYNDAIKYDFNGDGLFTNHLDLNSDGEVDLMDYEIGGLLIVNSTGEDWGDWGKAYIPYRLLALFGDEGGLWNRSVHVIDVVSKYQPLLTMKLELVHNCRNMIGISVGVSNDPKATTPDVIHNFPMFNYQGGKVSLGDSVNGNHMEIGIDITPLLSLIESDQPTKFFILVDENDPDGLGNGMIYNFEIINYSTIEPQVSSISGEYPILDNQTTILETSNTVSFTKLKVHDYPVQYVKANEWLNLKLHAEGLKGNGKWEIMHVYSEKTLNRPFPEIEGEELPPNYGRNNYQKIKLPFDFPFFGELHRTIFIKEEGVILLDSEYRNYPYAIDNNLATKQRKSIIPFGHDLSYTLLESKIFYHLQDTVVTVYWEAQASIGDSKTSLRFCCNLYPDGLIEFHYADYNLISTTTVEYLSGLSKGDGKTFLNTSSSKLNQVIPNQVVKFIPDKIPPNCKIAGNNLLLGRPEEVNQLYNIRVKVTDRNSQVAFGNIPISTLDFDSPESSAHNYPNPFSTETKLVYVIHEDSFVSIEIYDCSGRKRRTLLKSELKLGQYTSVWDGKTDGGSTLPTGLYYGQIISGDQVDLVKMIKVN